jgi:hypothetical protein
VQWHLTASCHWACRGSCVDRVCQRGCTCCSCTSHWLRYTPLAKIAAAPGGLASLEASTLPPSKTECVFRSFDLPTVARQVSNARTMSVWLEGGTSEERWRAIARGEGTLGDDALTELDDHLARQRALVARLYEPRQQVCVSNTLNREFGAVFNLPSVFHSTHAQHPPTLPCLRGHCLPVAQTRFGCMMAVRGCDVRTAQEPRGGVCLFLKARNCRFFKY